VRYSADGVPVLIHDTPWFRRGLPVPVGQTPASWLRALGAVTVADLFAELGSDFELSLDLKDTSVIAPLLRVLEAVDRSRVWLVHHDLDVLRRIRAQDGVVRLVHEAPGSVTEEGLRVLASSGVDAQNTAWRHWTPSLIQQAHGSAVRAFGSLVNTAADLVGARHLDGIYSDHVQLMVDTLRPG
jgi:glycerophosphoryl diester phosphodiesterase